MRVTDKMLFEAARRQTMRARERIDKAVWETSTGRRLGHPSDDPAASGLVSSSLLSIDRLEAIRRAAGQAHDEMQSMHVALDSISTVIARGRQIALQLSNDTNSADDRVNAATEVDGLVGTTAGVLNAQVGDRYIFAGFRDDAPPFDTSGNYTGDTGVRKIEVAPGVLQDVSIRADVAIKGTGGGVDVFGALAALATALRNDDRPSIQTALASLEQAHTQVGQALTEVSNHVNVLVTAETVSLSARDQVISQKSRLADADIMASSTELALANRALEAALAASSKSFGPTLLDWLK